MTSLMKTVIQICQAAGCKKGLFEDEHFYLKIENEPFMPLVIESWEDNGRVVSVAHYYESNGDLIPDPEILLYASTGYPIYMQDFWGIREVIYKDKGKTYIDPLAQKDVLSFMKTWAKNLKDQGFIQAAKKTKKDPMKKSIESLKEKSE